MPDSSRRDPPVPGDLLGPYRIVRLIGRGGMGAVYDAVDTTLDRHVALKVITPALADDPGMRERFVREARAQASLDSPHVVEVFAHGEDDGRLYLASRLMPDGDLGQHLRRHGPLPARLAEDIVAQVAAGLAAAHRAGLVHRDVKASNVLLRHRGTHTEAHLADFGIAAPLAHGGVADDLAALERLREALLGGPTGPVGRRGTRWSRPAVAALAGGAAAVAVVAAIASGAALLTPAPDPADGWAERAERAELARVLQQRSGLDTAAAACAARRLTGPPGVLEDPERRDDVLAAVAACLWRAGPAQPSASRTRPRMVATYNVPSGPR